MNSRSAFALYGLLFLSPALIAALGQNGPPEPTAPTIKANVRQVLVPVVVTDKSGRYVADLDRDDFSVYERRRAAADRGLQQITGWPLISANP